MFGVKPKIATKPTSVIAPEWILTVAHRGLNPNDPGARGTK
jgi:hypothetical protein